MDRAPDSAESRSAFSHCALLNLDWERILDKIRADEFPPEFYLNKELTQQALHADVERPTLNSNVFSPYPRTPSSDVFGPHPRTPFPSTGNRTKLALPDYLACRGAERQGGIRAEEQGVQGRRDRGVESQGDRTVGSVKGVSARVYDDGEINFALPQRTPHLIEVDKPRYFDAVRGRSRPAHENKLDESYSCTSRLGCQAPPIGQPACRGRGCATVFSIMATTVFQKTSY